MTRTLLAVSLLALCLPTAWPAEKQTPAPQSHDQTGGAPDPQAPPSREVSRGTGWRPGSEPPLGFSQMFEDWNFMVHGAVWGIYDHQGGPRGDHKIFSTSDLMVAGQRPLGAGTLGLRAMLSLDPLMGPRGYPSLLQTGETADGRTPLIDRQHPHDLFMELAASYSLPLSKDSAAFIYFGLPGEPALGPPTGHHRFSGADNPEVPITHHWLDSTHVAMGVLTLGYIGNNFKIDGSVFTGREPDQDRYDIESPRFDSGSLRLSYNPTPNWALQVSAGFLHSPLQLDPEVDVIRTTASIIYNRPFAWGNWQTTFAWGRNDSTRGTLKASDHTLDSYLLESAVKIYDSHSFFMRAERVAKDNLFLETDPFAGRTFVVNKVAFGYLYEFPAVNHLRLGIGALGSVSIVPRELQPVYGQDPTSYMAFARLRFL